MTYLMPAYLTRTGRVGRPSQARQFRSVSQSKKWSFSAVRTAENDHVPGFRTAQRAVPQFGQLKRAFQGDQNPANGAGLGGVTVSRVG